jgi:outer membrane protein
MQMKKKLHIAHVSIVTALSLLLLQSCQQKSASEENKISAEVAKEIAHENCFPVAYIDTDSLLREYHFANYLQEELLKKEEKSRTNFNEKANKLQNQMAEFQRKLQNNGFLSRDRAEKEQRNLVAREQELQNLNAKLSNELMQEQERVNRQLRDTLTKYLEEFNADGRYKMILSNTLGDNVLYSTPGVNITKDITEALNSRYQKSKAKE